MIHCTSTRPASGIPAFAEATAGAETSPPLLKLRWAQQYPVTVLTLAFLLAACNPSADETDAPASARAVEVERVARDYFATFAARRNWEKMLSFYRYDMVFEDITLQVKVFNKEDFKAFYNWEEGDFRSAAPDLPHLVLEDLLVDENAAVGRGHFNPFYYNGELQEWRWGSEFTIWLYFDENLKIKRQTDFIEYPDWILEDVIRRYKGSRDSPSETR